MLLVRPPESMGLLGRQIIHEPLNLLVLAAAARSAGADVRVLDLALSDDPGAYDRALREYDPHLIGYSAMTQDIHAAALLAEHAKRTHPDAVTVVGGVHASVLPERTLAEFPSFDMAVVGEGEATLAELTRRVACSEEFIGIPGVVRRFEENIVAESPRGFLDIENVPLPARDLVDVDAYLSRTSTPGVTGAVARVATLFTARGCPYRCSFCSGHITCGKNPRYTPLELVREEVTQLANTYGAAHITIKDDTFTTNPMRALAVGEILHDAGLTWDCKTRINTVERFLLEEMKRLGCTRLSMGVESGSDRVLAAIGKQISVDKVEQAFALTREIGFDRSAYFIIGADPDETTEEFEQSLALAKRIRPEFPVFSVIVPYPGTAVFRQLSERGFIFSEEWRRYNPFVQRPVWRTANFSPDDLMAMQKKAMTELYFSGWFIAGKLATLRHLSAWGYWARSAVDFIKYRKTRGDSGNPDPDGLV